jgi:hypothetical protein
MTNLFDKAARPKLDRLNPREPAPRRRQKAKPSDHWHGTRFIPPSYDGRVAVCFATGPSLTQEVVEQIRPYHEAGKVVACGLNDSYRIVDYLDELYACDLAWWRHHISTPYLAENRTVLDFPARLWGNQSARSVLNKHPHVNIVQGYSKPGFSRYRECIHWGANSGFQLLNLVYHMRVARMILVGYNMGVPKGQDHHFFGKHAKGMSQAGNYNGFVRQFRKIGEPARSMIVNCTPDSALDCFRKADLGEELEAIP